jgi:hypothetical protein
MNERLYQIPLEVAQAPVAVAAAAPPLPAALLMLAVTYRAQTLVSGLVCACVRLLAESLQCVAVQITLAAAMACASLSAVAPFLPDICQGWCPWPAAPSAQPPEGCCDATPQLTHSARAHPGSCHLPLGPAPEHLASNSSDINSSNSSASVCVHCTLLQGLLEAGLHCFWLIPAHPHTTALTCQLPWVGPRA